MARLRSGTRIGGRYLLTERLGKGGAGEVWGAQDSVLGTEVAVKLLRTAIAGPDSHARFAREGKVLARIDSPYICRVLDAPEPAPGEPPFLVIERLRGRPLDEVLKGGKTLPLGELIRLVDVLYQGAGAAHAASVVHRDIKPGNIVLVDDASVVAKIIDFGIAKLFSAETKLTTGDAMLGSPHYMAPEQLVDAMSADARSDIYAVATVAFRALAGTIPFRSGNLPELITLKRGYRAATLAEVTSRAWPAPLEQFFKSALARDREQRPQTAGDALASFRGACASLGTDMSFGGAARSPQMARTAEEDEFDAEAAETPVLVRSRP